MFKRLSVIAAMLLGMLALPARAGLISYDLAFKVDYIAAPSALPGAAVIGSLYTGSFTIDDTVLATDGIGKAGTLSAFRVAFGSVVWDMNAPSAFAGFRGPGIGAASPLFDVVGGAITNLRGGVYGLGDIPFIDFSVDASPACTADCANAANRFWSVSSMGAFGGSMAVEPITGRLPEPSSLALASLGFGLTGVSVLGARRRRR